MRVPVDLIDDIVACKAPVTVGMAFRLARALGTTPFLWARMQAESDIDTALEAKNIDTGPIMRLVPDHKVPHRMSGPTVGPDPPDERSVRIPLGTHPGKVLRESFLEALDIGPASLAENIGVPLQTILDFAACRTPATVDLGIRLAKALGTTASIWTRLQADHDVEQMRQQVGHEFDFIECMTPSVPVPLWSP